MSKPKVAFFDFACCEGCQLQMANFGEVLLDILNLVDIVTFREVMSEKSEIYDIAIIGSGRRCQTDRDPAHPSRAPGSKS